MVLSSVELVAVFVGWNVFRGHGKRGHFEVGMLKGIYGVDSRAPIQSEELFEEGNGTRAIPGDEISFVSSSSSSSLFSVFSLFLCFLPFSFFLSFFYDWPV